MGKSLEERLEKLGFVPYYVRDVPFGCILNAETADNYPLIKTDNFANVKTGVFIASIVERGEYVLMPPTNDGKYFEDDTFFKHRSLNEVVEYLENNTDFLEKYK
jgi:hypothetical protein